MWDVVTLSLLALVAVRAGAITTTSAALVVNARLANCRERHAPSASRQNACEIFGKVADGASNNLRGHRHSRGKYSVQLSIIKLLISIKHNKQKLKIWRQNQMVVRRNELESNG